MKPSPLHSVLFFLPDELSETTVYNIVIGILCILLGFSLVAIYRRIKYGSSFSLLEGMEGATNASPGLDPNVAELQSQTAALQTTYDKLTNEATNQKGRIDANSQTLMKALSPNQSNDITHANIDTDDPSKTKIPNIDMS
jgi:hypothetical protein